MDVRKNPASEIPDAEWGSLNALIENANKLCKQLNSIDAMIRSAHTCGNGHAMPLTGGWRDSSGEHSYDFVLDGDGVTETALFMMIQERARIRSELWKIAFAVAKWTYRNTAKANRASVRQKINEIGSMIREILESAKGKTPEEFLYHALLDNKQEPKAIEARPVNLEKPQILEKAERDEADKRRKAVKAITEALESFGILVIPEGTTAAYAITRYKFKLSDGQSLSKLEKNDRNIAVKLGVKSVSITASDAESQMIYIDVPNSDVKPLYFKDTPTETGKFFIGMSVDGTPVFGDMESLCHILIAGTTGSGKSTFLNALICSVIQNPPSENQFVMIDPKRGVELTPYNGIPHMARPVVTDAETAVSALEGAAKEMDRRYDLITESGVKKLSEYNAVSDTPLPRLIVIIDELADLMMTSGKKAEASVVRIARMGRAAGVHLVIATQRPTVKVITGQIKANIPCRIAFRVASNLESRIVLDEGGAEKLAGKGDMLFRPPDGQTVRLQGCYMRLKDIRAAIAKAGGE